MEVILAPGATEHDIGTIGNKHLMAVAAQLHGLLFVRQQEAEHHVVASIREWKSQAAM